MELCVPTNWQKEIITRLPQINRSKQIKEVYGKLSSDDVGGGRPSSSTAFISKRAAQRHIQQLADSGFKFNYLLNALCMDNIEFTRLGQKKLFRLMDWLRASGVSSVTVSIPYLAMWIKDNYPEVAITVSAMANVDSLNKAVFWDSLGVEKITFPGPAVNRNFSLIERLKKSLKCKIQLVANNACLLNCPAYINHALMNSHASQSWHACRGYAFDYHLIMCRYKRLQNPAHFLRSDWIRPEDIGFYERLGVDSIKLVDRRLSTAMILNIIEAYVKRSYQGNFLDLLHTFQGKTFNQHKGWMQKLFCAPNPFSVNIFKVLEFSRLLGKLEVFIDNKKLDGFLERLPRECDPSYCQDCGYCASIASRVVEIDREYQDRILKEYQRVIGSLFESGLAL